MDSLDNGFFALGSVGFQDPSGSGTRWIEIPSNHHGNVSTLNFADGHAVIRRWIRPLPPMGSTQSDNGFSPDPNNPDVLWLFAQATARK